MMWKRLLLPRGFSGRVWICQAVIYISYRWGLSCTWQCRLPIYLSTVIGLPPLRTCAVALFGL